VSERAERGSDCSVASCAPPGRMLPISVGGHTGHGAVISWRGARICGRSAQGFCPVCVTDAVLLHHGVVSRSRRAIHSCGR